MNYVRKEKAEERKKKHDAMREGKRRHLKEYINKEDIKMKERKQKQIYLKR